MIKRLFRYLLLRYMPELTWKSSGGVHLGFFGDHLVYRIRRHERVSGELRQELYMAAGRRVDSYYSVDNAKFAAESHFRKSMLKAFGL